MEFGVDFKNLNYFPNIHKISGYFRGMTFELDSKNHKHKMRLVNYLKEQGLDYWNAPIPKRILKNKNFDEDYLKKY